MAARQRQDGTQAKAMGISEPVVCSMRETGSKAVPQNDIVPCSFEMKAAGAFCLRYHGLSRL